MKASFWANKHEFKRFQNKMSYCCNKIPVCKNKSQIYTYYMNKWKKGWIWVSALTAKQFWLMKK